MPARNQPAADPEDGPEQGVETEYVTASGVSKQPVQIEQVPPGVAGATVVWRGEKQALRPGSIVSLHQGDHTDVIVPQTEEDKATVAKIGREEAPLVTRGAHYHFVRNRPTRVAAEHVEALLSDALRKFERVKD